MPALLQSWLDELQTDGLHLAAAPAAGANQNLWCISIPSDEPITKGDLLDFLRSARAIRSAQAIAQPVRPVTFYAWHDEFAGQLRFSTACCTPHTLPFGANLTLVDDPSEIVASFFRSPYRNGIPLHELQDCTLEETVRAHLPEAILLKVWAVELCALAT